MTKWLCLASAIVLEVIGSLSLRAALDRPGLYALVAIGYVGSFLALFLGLRAGLRLGVGYGIWGACGVALTAVMSWVVFGEPVTPWMAAGIVLVMGGVLLVEIGSESAQRRADAHDGTEAR